LNVMTRAPSRNDVWDIASHPRAAPIAVKLSDAVSTSAFLRSPIKDSEREPVLAHQATH
jgi:hypothetical protein